MPERAVSIPCDGDFMAGILHAPPTVARELGIVFIVGGPQYRVGSHRQFVAMARAFSAAGFPVLRFDYRGMGDSDGVPRTFENVSDDIRAAVDLFLKDDRAPSGVLLFGLCDGASAALMYCTHDPRVVGLMLANPWVRTQVGQARATARHHYLKRLAQASFWRKLVTGRLEWAESARGVVSTLRLIGRQSRKQSSGSTGPFLERMQNGMTEYGGHVLLLISGRDLTAREFEDLCRVSPGWRRAVSRPNVKKVVLSDADHTFSKAETLHQAVSESVAWLNKLRPY